MPTPPFGKLIDVPFTSDTPRETRLRAGTFCVFEDVVANAVVFLVTPAGPAAPVKLPRSRPTRLLLSLEGSLELAHQLIAAAARLRRAVEGGPDDDQQSAQTVIPSS